MRKWVDAIEQTKLVKPKKKKLKLLKKKKPTTESKPPQPPSARDDDVPSAATLYTAIDKNEDGRLSKSEIKKYLKAQPWAQAYITADHFTWKALWDKFDADGDGRLDEDEFGRWYTEELVPVLRTAIAEGKLEAREVDAPVKAAEASVGEGNETETVGAETVGEDPDVAAEVPTPKGTAHEAASEATPEATDGAATQPPNDPARGDQLFDDMSLCRRILTIGEAQQVEEAFERMDKDGNGLITFDEFTRAFRIHLPFLLGGGAS